MVNNMVYTVMLKLAFDITETKSSYVILYILYQYDVYKCNTTILIQLIGQKQWGGYNPEK